MADKRKYEHLFYEANRAEWYNIPSNAGKMTGLMVHGKLQNEQAPHFISINLIHKAGGSFGGGEPVGGEHTDELLGISRKLPHKHPEPLYETFTWVGTDPDNPDDLGGTVEFWIGEGEEAEQYLITKPTTVVIPPNLVHLPEYFREVHRPFVSVCILNTGHYVGTIEQIEVFPPGFEHVYKEQ